MCDKLYLKQGYCNPRLDKCLIKIIKQINKSPEFKTIASCCGHGKYNPTIIIRNKKGEIFEFFTRIKLQKKVKNRYYVKDKSGYYYLRELKEKGLLINL